MNKLHLPSKIHSFVAAAIITAASASILYQTGSAHAETDTVTGIKRGAQLYDNWTKFVKNAPETNHPLYPETSSKKGIATQRCKECHGWDYQGREGRYKSGSHYTGIKGILDQKDRKENDIAATLNGGLKGHDFSPYLTAADQDALVSFIRFGISPFVALSEKESSDTEMRDLGKKEYATHCASCHGDDGLAIDFKPKAEGVQGIGYLARENPQESIHKIRWGHPGSSMPSMVVDAGLDEVRIRSLLIYSTTLE